MCFQASDGKGNNFMDLLGDDFNIIKPSYIKRGPWLQAFGHSNSLCAKATYQLGNSVLDFFQIKISNAHATNILLRLKGIYSMNTKDLISTETLEEI